MESTNYFNTLIEIADDCPAVEGEEPPFKTEKKTVANLQFEMLKDHPYEYTSDDVLFTVFAMRKDIPLDELDKERNHYFSKGQPCFRSSPLTKRYGWGIHSDECGKIALYAVDSEEYKTLQENNEVKKTKAMRSSRK